MTPAHDTRIGSLGELSGTTGHIAIADPDAAPAGTYARNVLRQQGLWDTLAPRLVYAADVRQVALLVERGEVAAGFVYASDLAGTDRLRPAVRLAAHAAGAAVYEIALLRRAKNRPVASARFEDLLSRARGGVFGRYGLEPAGEVELPVGD